jgi:hypothetical protein
MAGRRRRKLRACCGLWEVCCARCSVVGVWRVLGLLECPKAPAAERLGHARAAWAVQSCHSCYCVLSGLLTGSRAGFLGLAFWGGVAPG